MVSLPHKPRVWGCDGVRPPHRIASLRSRVPARSRFVFAVQMFADAGSPAHSKWTVGAIVNAMPPMGRAEWLDVNTDRPLVVVRSVPVPPRRTAPTRQRRAHVRRT